VGESDKRIPARSMVGLGHKFELTIKHPGGKEIKALFHEATGLELHSRKLQGLRKNSHITLKRGYTADSSLSDWHSQVKEGKVSKAEARIVLLDESQKPIQRWKVSQAWPAKYEPSDLNAKGNEAAIEVLELSNEGLMLVDPD
jgi:phage tail-like protein